MNKRIVKYCFFILVLLVNGANGQFILNGTATHLGGGDYRLTPAAGGKVGSIWYEDKISLNESFELSFELYFGTKDNGADGISFCLQPLSTTVGVSGGGLGVGGVKPSFFAEFDTYRNGGDPSYDHVALQKNGDVKNTSSNNLANAVQIAAGVNNVENGQWYPMRAVWDANAKKFELYVNCQLRVSYTGDIVNQIFGGDPMVYWGFTASTGGKNNDHRVRNVNTDLVKMDDQTICMGGSKQINIPPTSNTFTWSPTTGIDNLTSLNPTFSPSVTTEYVITYNGNCNSKIRDTIVVEVAGSDLELGNDTTFCEGESLTVDAGNFNNYAWNTGANSKTINITSDGTYSVTVTDANGCTATDDIKITTEDCSCVDTDGDGVCDDDDLDDDNDGILDIDECMVSDFHWSAAPQVSGKTATGVINGVGYTYTASINIETTPSIFAYNRFPSDYNIPNTTVIKNRFKSNNKITFDQPVLNPTLMFSSIGGGGGVSVPIKFSDPVEVLFQDGPVTINSSTEITGKEGYVVLRMNGVFNEVSFDYLADENYVNFTFGADFATFCDTDSDGIADYLDPDSDGDGCLDALEGGSGFGVSDVAGETLIGAVDANGVPVLANGGQTLGSSANSSVLAQVCIPKIDTFYVCKGESVTIEKENIAIGEWSGSEAFTKLSEGSIKATPTKSTTYYLSSFVKKQNALVNGDFEQPNLGVYKQISDATVPGWSTTASDHKMEFWYDGFLGTPAYTGNQFVELNANMPAALYQDMATTPGDKLIWGFAHRGRNGVETMHFEVGPPGGPYVKIETVNTGKEWKYYSGIYEVPAGQTTTRFYYTSGNPGASGNLMDAVEFYTVEESVDSVVVIVNTIDEVDLGDDTTLCLGNTLNLDAGISGSYNWSNGASTKSIDVTTSGTYNVEVTSSEGCKANSTVKVEVIPCKTEFVSADTIEICKGETATIEGSGITVETWWSDAAFTQVNDSVISASPNVGEYVYYVGYSPEYADSVRVIVHENPSVTLGNDPTICEGDQAIFSFGVPGAYNWSTGETGPQIIATQSGDYTLNFTDENGCKGAATVTLTVNALPIVDLGDDVTICNGESLDLDAGNAGLNFNWNTGENTQVISVSTAGVYGLTVSDEIGCTGSDSMELFVNELPVVDLGVDQKICDGQEIVLDAQNRGLNFSWNTGSSSGSITINQSGIYGVEVTDEIGCLGSDSMELIVNPMPVVDLGVDQKICKGESVELDAGNPGYDYDWSTGESSQTITINSTGSYEVIVSDEIGCADTSEMNLIVNELPVVDLGNDTVICEYQSVVLDAENSGLNYVWNDGSIGQTLVVAEEGLYSVEVRDEIGCLGEDEIYVTKEIIADPFTEKEKIVCEGTSIVLEPDNPTSNTVFWFSDKDNSSIEVTETGDYNSVVVSEYCRDTFTIQVTKIDTPDAVIIDLNGQKGYCFDYNGTVLRVESTESGVEFDWNGLGRDEELEVNEAGDYPVVVTNEYCEAVYVETVKEFCEGMFFVPNAFTPGETDGVNDVFLPVSNGHVDNYELRIYNRWGVMIFSTKELDEGWDGTINSNIVQTDVYVYKISFEAASEHGGFDRKEQVGTVTLLK